MRICYIGWAHSIHAQRWVSWFVSRGHEVHFITDHPVPLGGVHIHDIRQQSDTRPRWIRYRELRLNIESARMLRTILDIRRLLKREIQPDILHLCTLYPPAQLGVYAGFRPLVVMPWNGDIIWTSSRSAFHGLMVRYAFCRADLIPLQTRFLSQRCIALGASEHKIRLVQFGVDLSRFSRGYGPDLREQLQLGDCPIVISTRAIFHNIPTLVRAIPIVLREKPDTKFVFTWPDVESESVRSIKRLSQDLGIMGSVRFVGRIEDHKQIARYLSLAQVFVSVALADCFSQSVLEAMACEVVPVISDLPPTREWVQDGWNGYVISPGEPESVAKGILKALRDDEATRRAFGERNRDIVRKRADFNKEMTRMEQLYTLLVRERRRS